MGRVYLRPKVFEALKLRASGLSLKSIGEILSLSPPTVAKYIHQAIDKVEEALSKKARLFWGRS